MIADIPLLVVGGAPIRHAETYRPILERAAVLVAVDRGGELCAQLGYVPAVLVGDMDSIAATTFAGLENDGVRLVLLDSRKDISDLHAALDLCAIEFMASPDVCAISGGRADHALAALGTLAEHAQFSPRILEPELEGWILAPSGCDTLPLPDAGATVSVIPLLGPARVTLHGLRYPLENTVLAPLSDRGLSNVVESPGASVTVHEGVVGVLVPAQA